MKSLLIMMAISLLAIVACIFLSNHVVDTCASLIEENISVQESAVAGDFESAMQQLTSMRDRWKEPEKHWEMICDHNDISRVTKALERAILLCGQENADRLELECCEITAALNNISEKESASIGNII